MNALISATGNPVELGLPNGLDAIDLAGGHSMQSYSDNLQAARQRNHNRQPTAARNTTVFQASGSVSLPVTIAAKTVTAANPHIKAIARLTRQTTIQRRRTICGLRGVYKALTIMTDSRCCDHTATAFLPRNRHQID